MTEAWTWPIWYIKGNGQVQCAGTQTRNGTEINDEAGEVQNE